MGFGTFVKKLFTSDDKGAEDPELIENLDRSWSGRARTGPLHYTGPINQRGSVNDCRGMKYECSLEHDGDGDRKMSNVVVFGTSSHPVTAEQLQEQHMIAGRSKEMLENESNNAPQRLRLMSGGIPMSSQAEILSEDSVSQQNKDSASSIHEASGRHSLPLEIGQSLAVPTYTVDNKGSFDLTCSTQPALGESLDEYDYVVDEEDVQVYCSKGRHHTLDKDDSSREVPEVWISEGAPEDSPPLDEMKRLSSFSVPEQQIGHSEPLNSKAIRGRSDSARASLGSEFVGKSVDVDLAGSKDGTLVLDTSIATEYLHTSESEDRSNKKIISESQTCGSSDLVFKNEERYGEDPESGSKDWNSKFVKRWKAVKQQARLQALGLRPNWRSSSCQSLDNEVPELLVNDLPEQRRRILGGLPSRNHSKEDLTRNPSLGQLLRRDDIC
eukprot:jgi/Picsp_1/4799/NSC_02167-R1_hypothetical protein CHLNCDRAFT_137793 [Chlorella variabilis]